MLTIFANLRINEPERLQHMKDSFFSFNTISDNWLINVRGKLRNEAITFLKENLGDKMVFFELLDDSRGWMNNALEMLPKAKYNYLLIWNEDHMNIASQDVYKGIIQEMEEQKVEYIMYSWWMFGKAREVFDKLEDKISLKKFKYIDTLYLTPKKWRLARKAGYPYFIISMCGIFHKDLLEKLLIEDRKKWPMFLTKFVFKVIGFLTYKLHILKQGRGCTKDYFYKINKLFFHKLTRNPKECPVEIEKNPERTDVLPLKIAFSKQELFACIDDDLDMEKYSLIKRGLYPLK